MTIKTNANFFFIAAVTVDNFQLSFSEGGPELIAQMEISSYSPGSFIIELSAALNRLGGQVYTVILDRSTRKVTISAPGNFELLISSGSSAGTSVFDDVGFTGADLSGSNSYIGDSLVGSIYRPQFLLQSFIDFEENQQRIQSKVNESASGKVEVVSFGTRKIMECKIVFITDINQGTNGPITTNLTGRTDAISFMVFITNKNELEFIPDELSPFIFKKILLESSSSSKDGTAFVLRELTGRGLIDYFETGRLKFREVPL